MVISVHQRHNATRASVPSCESRVVRTANAGGSLAHEHHLTLPELLPDQIPHPTDMREISHNVTSDIEAIQLHGSRHLPSATEAKGDFYDEQRNGQQLLQAGIAEGTRQGLVQHCSKLTTHRPSPGRCNHLPAQTLEGRRVRSR